MHPSYLRLQRLHHFLAQHGFYPIFLSTMLVAALFIARYFLYHSLLYRFLPWNLFLAWVPYLFSLWAAYLYRKHKGALQYWLLPALIWLPFFPNAPYLVTDFVHLRLHSWSFWYDIGLLTTGVWTGLFLGIYSLRTMQQLVKDRFGLLISWLFVIGTLGLSGLGIYLGRFLRWNSWDLVFQPRAVLGDTATLVINPRQNLQAIGVTLLFATFLFICYLTLTVIPSKEPQ
jgi:uncharacterized membrane protein